MSIQKFRKRETWLRARKTFVGASESPAILGVGYANQSALSVYTRKIKDDDEPEQEVSQALQLGHFFEHGILMGAKAFYGVQARPCGLTVYRSEKWPFIACTPDALTPS